jgi:hypothetical protein
MSIRQLDSRLARAEQAARQAAPRLGPETFWLRCGHGPVEIPTNWRGEREFAFGGDHSSPLLGAFELDGEPHVMPEAEARAFLDEEFRRRGWQPLVIVVQYDDDWQGT